MTATVTANAETVPEGNAAEFTVELTGGTSTADVIVNYTWEASTGTAGTDYTEPSGLLTITKPDSSGTIAIAIKADDVLDLGETLSVTLTGATTAIGTAALGTPKTATTTIAEKGTVIVSVRKDEVPDDDTTQNVNEYQDKSTVEEGEAASFVVELSGAVASAVEVAYATSNGTGAGHAVAGTDYAVTKRHTHFQLRRVPYPDRHRDDHRRRPERANGDIYRNAARSNPACPGAHRNLQGAGHHHRQRRPHRGGDRACHQCRRRRDRRVRDCADRRRQHRGRPGLLHRRRHGHLGR